MSLWLKRDDGTLVPVGGSGGGFDGEHVLTGDPAAPPAELEVGQLLWDGVGSEGGPSLMVQYGEYFYDGASGTGYGPNIVFPKAFAVVPSMTATVQDATSASVAGYYVKIAEQSATSFRMRHYQTNGFWGDPAAPAPGPIQWVAIGVPLDPADANVGTGPTGPQGPPGDDGGIESGDNANGSWTKFPDGTMICWHSWEANIFIDSAYGNLFISSAGAPWTFPVQFTAAPVVTVGKAQWGTGASWGVVFSAASDACLLRTFDNTARTDSSATAFMATAHGRWK